MSTPRRRFLGWLGASALAGATTRPLAAAGHALVEPPAPLAVDWDMSWVDRITGKHRAVFDSPEVSDGSGLFRAFVWRDQYREVYGTDPRDMSMVVVIRHAAIPLIMNDAYWARFPIGERVEIRDPATREWTKKNPILTTPSGMPPSFAEYNLPAFFAAGGIVLACDLAFRRPIQDFVTGDKLTPAEARAKAVEHIIPGVIMQPSGIFAALRAQEAGCGYIMASEA